MKHLPFLSISTVDTEGSEITNFQGLRLVPLIIFKRLKIARSE
jgi:hypothetical protein